MKKFKGFFFSSKVVNDNRKVLTNVDNFSNHHFVVAFGEKEET